MAYENLINISVDFPQDWWRTRSGSGLPGCGGARSALHKRPAVPKTVGWRPNVDMGYYHATTYSLIEEGICSISAHQANISQPRGKPGKPRARRGSPKSQVAPWRVYADPDSMACRQMCTTPGYKSLMSRHAGSRWTRIYRHRQFAESTHCPN